MGLLGSIGQFTIIGTVSGHQVQFVKQYLGQHSVEYQGTLTKDKKTIEGTWAMPAYGMRDTFKIQVYIY